jgi:hypothetical protein
VALVDTVGGGLGIYNLDAIGYTRDILPAVLGGTHTLAATYSGDSSYTSSQARETFSVQPASVSIGQDLLTNPPLVGTPFFDSITAYSPALVGAAPSGTVSFFDGTTQLGSPVAIQASPSAGYSPAFFATGSMTIATGGSHTIVAKYSGDTNYATASVSTTVNTLYVTT